jgi:hypothetical protein
MPAEARARAKSWWMSTGQQRVLMSMDSTQPERESAIKATDCKTPSVVSQKKVVLAGCPSRRPVRPMRGKNALTVSGLLIERCC